MIHINYDTLDDLTQMEIDELRSDLYRPALLPHIFKYCDEIRSKLMTSFETPEQAVNEAMIKAKLILNGQKISCDEVMALGFIDRILRADVFDLTEIYDDQTIAYVKEYSRVTLESVKTLT